MSQIKGKSSKLETTVSSNVPDPEVKPAKPRRRFSRKEKLRILSELDNCVDSGEVGSLLRREGIYSSYLTRWKREKEQGILNGSAQRKRGRKPNEQAKNQEELARLRAENQRLQQRLQKAEAIIDIQKKVSILLGLEEKE